MDAQDITSRACEQRRDFGEYTNKEDDYIQHQVKTAEISGKSNEKGWLGESDAHKANGCKERKGKATRDVPSGRKWMTEQIL